MIQRGNNVGAFLINVVITAMLMSTAIAGEDEIVFGFGSPYCPFKCDRETQGSDGFEVDILREIFQKKGLKLIVRRIPETRVLPSLEDGFIDIATQLQWTIDRTSSVIAAEEPVSVIVLGALYRAEMDFRFSGVDNLKPLRFVGNLGSEWPGEMQAIVDEGIKSGRNMLISDNDYYNRVFGLLETKRVDITIDDMSVLRYEMRRANIEDRFKLDRATEFDSLPSYAIFAKSHPRAIEFRNMVETGMRQLRKSGRLKEILGKYGAADWRP